MNVTILIPIYNGIEYIEESVSSVIKQTYKNWEIIIGINGHPKNSNIYKIAKKYESNKIKVYDFDTSGKSNTLNKMVTLAKYKYVAILDIDDIWLPNKLEKQFNILKNNNYDVIGTCCRYFGDLSNSPKISIGHINNNVFRRMNTIINSSAIIKKEFAYWNPEYESVEDYELWVRLAIAGKQFYNLSDILVKHRIHNNSAFNSKSQNKQKMLVQKIKNIYYS